MIRKSFILLCLFMSALPVVSTAYAYDQIELPDLGDPSGSALSLNEEIRIGGEIMQQIHNQRVMVDDLLTQEYINTLGYKLLGKADSAIHDFHFFVIRDDTINAFALPGGYIGFNAGLIMVSDNENELAAVMAHEISHVTQRHLARAYFYNQRMQGPLLAAMIAGILLGGEAAQAAIVAANAGAQQTQINFTRKNEQEADSIGIALLANAGYDPYSMATLFDKMYKQSRLYGGAPPEFLSTHPVYDSRISDAQLRAQQYPKQSRPDSVLYRVIKARLKVLLHPNPARLANEYERMLNAGQTSDEIMDRYAYTMALLESEQLQQAYDQSEILLTKQPSVYAFHLIRAEIDLRAGRDVQALNRLKQLLHEKPDNHVITMEYSRMLINTGRAQQARKLLEDHKQYRSGDPAVYRLLSYAAKAVGDSAHSHAYMAESYRLVGNTEQAISHTEAALKGSIRDYYFESSLQARLKELQKEKKEKEKNKNL
jgi:predicted Zn-dependent protease